MVVYPFFKLYECFLSIIVWTNVVVFFLNIDFNLSMVEIVFLIILLLLLLPLFFFGEFYKLFYKYNSSIGMVALFP